MENRIKWFEQECKKHGIKLTPQRVGVYKVLAEAVDHPSADVVYQRVRKLFPNVSLDTVNRTLLTFSELGIAFIVEGSGDVRRYDGGLGLHQHFKCVKCKRIVDFHHEPFDNITVPEELDSRFEILRKTVYFEGLCEDCKNKGNEIN